MGKNFLNKKTVSSMKKIKKIKWNMVPLHDNAPFLLAHQNQEFRFVSEENCVGSMKETMDEERRRQLLSVRPRKL